MIANLKKVDLNMPQSVQNTEHNNTDDSDGHLIKYEPIRRNSNNQRQDFNRTHDFDRNFTFKQSTSEQKQIESVLNRYEAPVTEGEMAYDEQMFHKNDVPQVKYPHIVETGIQSRSSLFASEENIIDSDIYENGSQYGIISTSRLRPGFVPGSGRY